MKKIAPLIGLLTFLLMLLFIYPHISYASCGTLTLDKNGVDQDYKGPIVVSGTGCFVQGKQYVMKAVPEDKDTEYDSDWAKASSNDQITFSLNVFQGNLGSDHQNTWTVYVCYQDDTDKNAEKCNKDANGGTYFIGKAPIQIGGDKIPEDGTPLPKLDPAAQTACRFQIESEVTLRISNLTAGKTYEWWEDGTDHKGDITVGSDTTETSFTIPKDEHAFDTPGEKTICADVKDRKTKSFDNCIKLSFEPTSPDSTSCTDAEPQISPVDPPCAVAIDTSGCTSINTAIGLFKTTPETLLTSLFAVFLSLAGGIAVLMIIRSGYQLLTSQGNAEKVKEAQDRITSAVVGLLFALFAIVVLESIGVDILHLPGLGH